MKFVIYCHCNSLRINIHILFYSILYSISPPLFQWTLRRITTWSWATPRGRPPSPRMAARGGRPRPPPTQRPLCPRPLGLLSRHRPHCRRSFELRARSRPSARNRRPAQDRLRGYPRPRSRPAELQVQKKISSSAKVHLQMRKCFLFWRCPKAL